MPTVYLGKEPYAAIIRRGLDPGTYVDKAVRAALKREGVDLPPRGFRAPPPVEG